ncbi:toll-like receptor 7 isoform X2 [Contarinia nasturtii]|uniref:toll-like receptor 7 isoform X2 n=1 Tax=Contarinia nasturtii TaxID=265458 RepID=UPI0012D48F05|nr:toll-like receptor 7 isoform X2 [Contarinia nasturtii]XP_031638950.1 toll-like receptor 7 isoform X2 [Contarinia nasturtii]
MQNNLVFCSIKSSMLQLIYIKIAVVLNIIWMVLPSTANATAGQCTWDYSSSKLNSITCRTQFIDHTTNLDSQLVQDYDKLTIQCSENFLYESQLPKNAFAQLRNLNDLNIDSCKLLYLPSDTLSKLKGLKTLTIRTRNVDWGLSKSLELNISSFQSLKELEVLNLIESGLRTIPEGVFCELPTLQVLNITRNRIRSTENLGILPKTCTAAAGGVESDLRILDLSRNELGKLTENWSVAKLRRLQQLNLEHNNITEISGEALAGLPSLRIFNISHNQLESLPNGLFAGARDFQEIHLQHNKLFQIPRGLFHKLEQLLILDLSGNRLSSQHSIDNTTFSGLIRLIVLNLAHNALTRIDAKTFRDLYFLQILDVRNNSIGHIEDNTFLPLYNLHTLNLAENRLHTINEGLFNGLFVLSKLTLNNNNIRNIASNAFKNCSDLKELDLSTNQLQEIPMAIQNLTMLRTLDLGENHISDISTGAFRSLNQLTGLRLIDNQIGNVTREMFTNLPRLSVLNLAKNRIQYIERGSFDTNNEIEALRLDRNFINDINGVFATLNSLLWLNLAENHLVWFDYAFIPRSLKWLDLHDNYITDLGNYYKLQEEISLKTLDASHNRLREIGPSSIPNSIELLFINNNMINLIQLNTFVDKINLTRVDLYSNALKKIHLHTLRLAPIPSTKPLPEFYLGDNPFECDCSMDWLQSVNSLTARQHPRIMDYANIECVMPRHERGDAVRAIASLDAKDFLCKYEIMCFALCHCCDFDACDCEMICPTNCTCYHDQTWTTNVVDCGGGQKLGGQPANVLPKKVPMDTTALYLDGNIITELQNNAFIGRKNLKQLYLNNSALYRLQKRSLAGLHSIETIHLNHNHLRTLHGHEFENMDQLKTLYLHNNRLEYIANDTFVPLKALQLLRIDGNRLVTMMMFHTTAPPQNFPNLKSLSIGRNTWSCRCPFLKELSTFVIENAVILDDSQDIYCIDGAIKHEIDFNSNGDCRKSYEGRSVLLPDISINEHIPLLLTSLILIIIVTILILIIIFREPIRIWLFAKCGVRICETIGEDYEKLYDAMFLYSEKDHEHAIREIVAELEIIPPHLRLCLQHRDLTHDASYLQVLESARASKRVVILLSRNFLQTEWSRYEANDALLEAENDLELLPYIKSRVVNGIKLSDKHFWEKLRYVLPSEIQQRCNNYTLHNHQSLNQPHPLERQHKFVTNSHQTQSASMQLHHPLHGTLAHHKQLPPSYYQQDNDEANYSSATIATPSSLGRRSGGDEHPLQNLQQQQQQRQQRPPSEHIYFSIESDYSSTVAGTANAEL